MKFNYKVCILVFCSVVFFNNSYAEDKGLFGLKIFKKKENSGAVIGGAAGGIIADKLADKNKREWAIIGAFLGAYIGKEIGRQLDDRDKALMAKSTQESLITGNSSTWKNSESKTNGSIKVIGSETKQKPIKVKVLKSKVKKVPPLDIIGSTYKATSFSNVRGGPSPEYEKVGSLEGGEIVNVIGKVKDENWYMISQQGVGSGFVWGKLLQSAPGSEISNNSKIDKSDVVKKQVASNRICRTVEQTVRLADGSIAKDQVEACQSAKGWKVKKASIIDRLS